MSEFDDVYKEDKTFPKGFEHLEKLNVEEYIFLLWIWEWEIEKKYFESCTW